MSWEVGHKAAECGGKGRRSGGVEAVEEEEVVADVGGVSTIASVEKERTLFLLKLTGARRQVENHARYLRMMGNRTVEDLDIDEADFQQLLGELTDANNNLV